MEQRSVKEFVISAQVMQAIVGALAEIPYKYSSGILRALETEAKPVFEDSPEDKKD